MVRMPPISTTTKPAPARKRNSRTVGVCPVGAPTRAGLSEKEYCVLATQTGRPPPTGGLEVVKLPARGIIGRDVVGAVNFASDRARLFPQAHRVRIKRPEVGGPAIGERTDDMRQVFAACAAAGPMVADDGLDAELGRGRAPHEIEFGVGVAGKAVDGDRDRHAKLVQVGDVTREIGESCLQRGNCFRAERVLGGPAMHLERAHGGDDDCGGRLQPGHPALYVKEFLRAEIGAESGFGRDVVAELERCAGRDHGVAAVGDIGERTAMHERRRPFERLHEIGTERP